MKVLVMRHGKNSYADFRDAGLTEQGRQEAEAAAASIALLPIVAIYSSPALRARQTAEIVSEQLAMPMNALDRLRDVKGTCETLPWQQVWLGGLPMFESAADFLDRIRVVLGSIIRRHHSTDTVLIVGHEETVWALMSIVNEAPIHEAAKTKIKNASVTEFIV